MSEPAEVIPLVDRSHVLYRMYDRARELLYVGITFDAKARWKQHSEDKEWWTKVASVDLEHFTSRTAAERAEQKAIKKDRPMYNVTHQYRPTPVRPLAGPPMKHRNVRMDDRTWFAASRVAELQGKRISDLVRSLLAGFVAKNRKLLENDPAWQETCRERGWVA